jgi:hypothetical protein
MEVSGQRHPPAALRPRGKDRRYALYRRLGGPHSQSGGTISYPCRGSNLDRLVIQSVARHYTDWATPAHITSVIKGAYSCSFNIVLPVYCLKVVRTMRTYIGFSPRRPGLKLVCDSLTKRNWGRFYHHSWDVRSVRPPAVYHSLCRQLRFII